MLFMEPILDLQCPNCSQKHIDMFLHGFWPTGDLSSKDHLWPPKTSHYINWRVRHYTHSQLHRVNWRGSFAKNENGDWLKLKKIVNETIIPALSEKTTHSDFHIREKHKGKWAAFQKTLTSHFTNHWVSDFSRRCRRVQELHWVWGQGTSRKEELYSDLCAQPRRCHPLLTTPCWCPGSLCCWEESLLKCIWMENKRGSRGN